MAFKDLLKSATVEICSCDHEACDSGSIDWLFALLLELEGDLVLDVLLDGFGRHGSALLLDDWQLDGVGISEKSHNIVVVEEQDALSAVFELFSEHWKERNVHCGSLLLRFAEECAALSVSQS